MFPIDFSNPIVDIILGCVVVIVFCIVYLTVTGIQHYFGDREHIVNVSENVWGDPLPEVEPPTVVGTSIIKPRLVPVTRIMPVVPSSDEVRRQKSREIVASIARRAGSSAQAMEQTGELPIAIVFTEDEEEFLRIGDSYARKLFDDFYQGTAPQRFVKELVTV